MLDYSIRYIRIYSLEFPIPKGRLFRGWETGMRFKRSTSPSPSATIKPWFLYQYTSFPSDFHKMFAHLLEFGVSAAKLLSIDYLVMLLSPVEDSCILRKASDTEILILQAIAGPLALEWKMYSLQVSTVICLQPTLRPLAEFSDAISTHVLSLGLKPLPIQLKLLNVWKEGRILKTFSGYFSPSTILPAFCAKTF